MKEYFGLGYMQSPNTIYEGIFQVNPGEIIKISNTGAMVKNVFTDIDMFPQSKRMTDKSLDLQELEDTMSEVVRRQLVSDVPLANFLSGGIDSPLIAAVAHQYNPALEAFTIGLDNTVFDESKKAAAYADHINLNHRIKPVQSGDLLNCIDAHFNFLSEPFGDYSSIPTFLITKYAKMNHTVMLSGDGADELFFGYPRMQDIVRKRHWFKIPFAIRKPLVRLALKVKLTDSWGPYMFKNISQWILHKQIHITRTNLQHIFPKMDFTGELRTLYTERQVKSKLELLQWLRQVEFYGHLQRVLTKVDRMSMANSMEVRVPYLDRSMIQKSLNYNPPFQGGSFNLKGILKRFMESFYPPALIAEKKQGFSVPIGDWLRSELRMI